MKACVKSILSQTLDNFNFIILDNCSTDGTLAWLQLLQDKRIKIIPSERPLTIEESWGRIKDIQKNEYITLIGHDDLLYPDFLENIDQLITQHPNASLFHTHFDFIDAAGKVIRKSKPMKPLFSANELLKGFLLQNIDSMGTGYVMRAADYDAVGGIPVKYPNLLFADFELWQNIADRGMVAVSPKTSFAFRVHQSTTGTSGDIQLHRALDLYVDFLTTQEAQSKVKREMVLKHGQSLLLYYCKGFSHRLLRTSADKRNGATVNKFIEETKLMAKRMGVEKGYHPEKIKSIQIAQLIDSSNVLSRLFLLFKKLNPKPMM